jgi:hypothetical protein
MNDNNMEAVASEDWFTRELFLKVEQERDELRAEVERLRMEFHREHTEHAITYRQVEAEVERLRAALLRLVELGHDDGSAPETAWKDAFEHAETLVSDKEW